MYKIYAKCNKYKIYFYGNKNQRALTSYDGAQKHYLLKLFSDGLKVYVWLLSEKYIRKTDEFYLRG